MDHAKRHRAVVDRAAQYLVAILLIGIALYVANRLVFLRLYSDIPFFRTSFDDLLALIVFVPLSYLGARKLQVIPPNGPLRFWHIVLGWVIFSLFFEAIIPRFVLHRTSDFYDVVAYAGGGFVLWLANLLGLDQAYIRTIPVRVVYFDGRCGICSALADWSKRHVRSTESLIFSPYQSLDQTTSPELFVRAKNSVVVQFTDGTELDRARAIGAILTRLTLPWSWFGWLCATPLFWPLTTVGYLIFARYRQQISAWTGHTACEIE